MKEIKIDLNLGDEDTISKKIKKRNKIKSNSSD